MTAILVIVDFVRPVEAVIPGAQGRVLAVLAETTAELNLRTIARLSGASQAQVSRVLPRLVGLGIVERREVPPSSLFRLVPENVAADVVLGLARSRERVLERLGRAAANLPVPPVSVIVFGSLARGEADRVSDIDVVLVRPEVDEDDDGWTTSVDLWQQSAVRAAGNAVEVLQVSAGEAAARLSGRRQLWRDIAADGVVVYGLSLTELGASCRSRSGFAQ
jgi:hypothetical protein